MEFLIIGLLLALVVAARVWDHPGKLATIQDELSRRKAEQTGYKPSCKVCATK